MLRTIVVTVKGMLPRVIVWLNGMTPEGMPFLHADFVVRHVPGDLELLVGQIDGQQFILVRSYDMEKADVRLHRPPWRS